MQQSVASAQSRTDIARIEAEVSPNRGPGIIKNPPSGNATMAMESAVVTLVKDLIRISK